jgi:hypothetical protein
VVGVDSGRAGPVRGLDRFRRHAWDVGTSLALLAVAALLLQAARPALGLTLLGALAVTRHASAGLFVRGVLPAPAAVLAELDPVRVVPLRLLALVVTPLALLAREGDGDSNVSASHGSFGR